MAHIWHIGEILGLRLHQETTSTTSRFICQHCTLKNGHDFYGIQYSTNRRSPHKTAIITLDNYQKR